MQDMAGDGKKIGFRATDGFVVFDSHEPQENLLREIGRVGAIAQP